MKLTHYPRGGETLETIRSVASEEQGLGCKPKGFWVSIDEKGEGWQTFNKCDAESLCYEITLRADAKILFIRSAEEMDAFTEAQEIDEYGRVNWQPITKEYDGIIIPHIIGERRLIATDLDSLWEGATEWYYPWDCASGCIWNAAAIESFSRMAPDLGLQVTVSGPTPI